jgi:hypothetical protein
MIMGELNVTGVLVGALHTAHYSLDGTMADVDDEIANRLPPGKANPIGAAYLHVSLSEDYLVNVSMRKAQHLFAGEWAGRTGADKMPPGPAHGDIGEWYRTVKTDVAQAKAYTNAVFEMSEAYVASLTDSDLAGLVEGFPIPNLTLAGWVEVFLIGHANALCGEISAIKGTYGLKGYPY